MKDQGANLFVKLIITAVLSIPVAVVFYLIFSKIAPILGVLFAVIGYLIAVMGIAKILINRKKKVEEDQKFDHIFGVDGKKLQEVMAYGELRLKEIRNLNSQIKETEVKEKAKRIEELVKAIFDDFKEDPKDIRSARSFLNYYLDSTIKILSHYVDLSKEKIRTPDVDNNLKKAETLLGTIEESFKKQLNKLKQNNLMEMETEMEVLEKTLNMEDM